MSGIRTFGNMLLIAVIGALAWFPFWGRLVIDAATIPNPDGALLLYLTGWAISWMGWRLLSAALVSDCS